MKDDHLKRNIILTITLIFVYLIIGIVVNYIGMKIYCDDLNLSQRHDGLVNIKFTVQNNAPLTLPFCNSLYYYGAEIQDGNVSCRVSDYDCGWKIDMKKLESGENYKPSVKVFTQNDENFTIKLKSYLNLFNIPILPKSITLSCIYSGERGNEYICEKI